jgi:hypothetical protein
VNTTVTLSHFGINPRIAISLLVDDLDDRHPPRRVLVEGDDLVVR